MSRPRAKILRLRGATRMPAVQKVIPQVRAWYVAETRRRTKSQPAAFGHLGNEGRQTLISTSRRPIRARHTAASSRRVGTRARVAEVGAFARAPQPRSE